VHTQKKLTGPEKIASAGDEMGDENQVAVIRGKFVAVGAYGAINGTGAVYIFPQQKQQQQPSPSDKNKESTGTTPSSSMESLQAQQVLYAQGGNPGDRFGYSVAMSGGACTTSITTTTLVVGAPLDPVNGHYSGSVYVFRPADNTNRRIPADSTIQYFTQIAKLVPRDGSTDHRFGVSVDVDHDEVTDKTTIVIGAIYTADMGPDSGSAYVFQEMERGVFTQIAKLLASNGRPSARYGWNVAIDNEVIVVGTLNARTVYVYQKHHPSSSSSSSYTETARLTASDANGRRNAFGSSVDISENTIVVGAYLDDNTNGIKAGAVYVFYPNNNHTPKNGDNDNNYTSLYESIKLVTSDGFINHRFGIAVAIDKDVIVVGCTEDNASTGSTYVFRDIHGDAQFTESAKITASDGSSEDFFGASVAIHDSIIVVGAYGDDYHGAWSGSAYEFQLEEASASAPSECQAPMETSSTDSSQTENEPSGHGDPNQNRTTMKATTTKKVDEEL
jgi:hypothetical protein